MDCKKACEGSRCNACKQKRYRERKKSAKIAEKLAKSQTMSMFTRAKIEELGVNDAIKKMIYDFFGRYGEDGVNDLLWLSQNIVDYQNRVLSQNL